MTQPEVIDIGCNNVLLFDDAYTQAKRGFRAVLGSVARDVEPVLMADQPWEADGIVGDSNVTVMEDGGVYRMWYVIRDPRGTDDVPINYTPEQLAGLDEKMRADLLSRGMAMLCHAQSSDGIHWEKPVANIIEFAGSRANNMLMSGRMGCTVFKDPTAPAEQRYKMIHGYGQRLPQVYREGPSPARMIFHAIYGSTSSDGLHWTPSSEPIIPWYTDTTNVAYWDDRIGQYVAFMRFNQNLGFADNKTVIQQRQAEHYRAIGRSQSGDFFHFPQPQKIAEPSPRERRPRATGMDYYNSSAVKYAGSRDAYLMFSSNFYHEQDVLQVHLATSRDGVNYDRWIAPLFGLGLDGSWDSRSIYMGTGMIRRGGELWMYYHGRSNRHGEKASPGSYPGGIGRVRLRVDGFVSQDAGPAGGKLLTKPIRFDGDRLVVNYDAAAGGRMKVELCDVAGKALSGFAAADADWLWYNKIDGPVSWKGSTDLSSLRGQTVRLNFIGKAVKLYSFRFEGASGR